MYKNLKDAWIVLCLDNIPPQIRAPDEVFEERIAPLLREQFSQEDLEWADEEFEAWRRPMDIDDIDSPLWQICAGEEGNEYLVQTTDKLNNVLNEMFELL